MHDQVVALEAANYAFEFPGGRTVYADPIEALIAIRKISDNCKGSKNFEHLAAYRQWLKEHDKRNPDDISLGEADRIWDAVQKEYAQGKAKLMESLNLSGSTEPKHSISLHESDLASTDAFDD